MMPSNLRKQGNVRRSPGMAVNSLMDGTFYHSMRARLQPLQTLRFREAQVRIPSMLQACSAHACARGKCQGVGSKQACRASSRLKQSKNLLHVRISGACLSQSAKQAAPLTPERNPKCRAQQYTPKHKAAEVQTTVHSKSCTC